MDFSAHQFLKGLRCVKADAHGVGAVNGPDIDTRGYREALFVILIDDVGAAGTVDFKVQETATSGSGHADISSAAIAQKVAAGVFVGRVDLSKRKQFLRGVLTIGANAVDAAVVCVLANPDEQPATQVAAAEFNV